MQRRGGVNPMEGGGNRVPLPSTGGTSRGHAEAGAMWHQGEGVCLHPYPLCTPSCVGIFLQGRGQQVEASLGGQAAFPHFSQIHRNMFLFMCCFALFLLIFTLSFYGNTNGLKFLKADF
jgi:hypothetical protein